MNPVATTSPAAGADALRTSQELYETLVAHLPCAVYVTTSTAGGLGGPVAFVSPPVQRLFGLPAASWLGADGAWTGLLHPEDRERVLADVARPLCAGERRELEYRLRIGDRVVWVRDEAVPVLDAAGEPAGTQGLLADLTDAKAAEYDRRRIQQELHLAQKLESVGQLAAGIAHEINTPVQFIGDSVQFLRAACEDLIGLVDHHRELALASGEEAADAVAGAEEAADLDYLRRRVPAAADRVFDGVGRVSRLVQAMKGFGCTGVTDFALADVDLAIENTLVVAHGEYRYCADVETELGLGGPVLCSVADINQVLLNLVVNAAHAIEERHRDGTRGSIRIRSRREDGWAVVSVSDDGDGIDDDVLPRIFDPFFTTRDVGAGTGQGLAIVHRIVTELHHGTISVETRRGEGTTFTVRIPAGDGR